MNKWICSEDFNPEDYTGFVYKITNLTNKVNHPLYLLRFHDVDDREKTQTSKNTEKHYHLFQKLDTGQKCREIMSSGLNNLEYTILERKMIHDIVEIIKVEI